MILIFAMPQPAVSKPEENPAEGKCYSETFCLNAQGYMIKININKTIITVQPQRYEGQCVAWVKKRTGFNHPVGIARNILNVARQNNIPTGDTPQVGAILVLDTPNYAGHAAVVESIGPTYIVISESNFLAPSVYSERQIEIDDDEIMGYAYV